MMALYETISAVFPEGLGAAIQPAEESDGQIRQVFERGIMRYDLASQKAFLEPIGYQQIETAQSPVQPESGPTWRNIQGYWMPASIASKYDRLGAEIFGRPLSNYTYNPEKNRYEIYFENLGMYILDGDPSQTAHLLPYGTWATAITTSPATTDDPAQRAILRNAADEFNSTGQRLGSDYTGEMIVGLTIDEQKRILRVYENIVMVWDAAQGEISWLNVPEMLGVQPEPLTTRVSNPQMTFLALDPAHPEMGHNIPIEFWKIIRFHSGTEVSGPPITELRTKPDTNDRIWWQCFEHICIEYDSAAGTTRLSPLGRLYYERFLQQLPNQNLSPPLSQRPDLQIYQTSRQISPNTAQQVQVYITSQGKPLANISLKLELHLPDGQVKFLWFPPTDEAGQTNLTLPVITAPNNTPVNYLVCTADDQFCMAEQFVIWAAP
ncbi:MAG: hypothetical protein Fur0018_19250 [Anaerolineales bacterium]